MSSMPRAIPAPKAYEARPLPASYAGHGHQSAARGPERLFAAARPRDLHDPTPSASGSALRAAPRAVRRHRPRSHAPVPSTSGATRSSTRSSTGRSCKSEHFDNFFYPAESLDRPRRRPHGRAMVRAALGHLPARVRSQVAGLLRRSPGLRADERHRRAARGRNGRRHRVEPRRASSCRSPASTPTTITCSATSWCTCSSTTSPKARRAADSMRLDALPLWLIEGMAEYFSLGRDDPLTAMWMRDAGDARQVPDDQAAHDRPALLPVSLRPGAVGVRRRTLGRSRRSSTSIARRCGSAGTQALVRVLGENQRFAVEGLGRGEPARCTARCSPAARIPTAPATKLVRPQRERATYNLAPTISPDGKLVRVLLEPQPVQHRAVRRRRADGQDHQEARRARRAIRTSTRSASSTRPATGRRTASKFAFIVYAEGNNEIAILDTKSTNVERRIKLPGIGAVSHVVVVARRAHARVLRPGRRHQRSVSARSPGRNDPPADERPVRRHPADVVARRQDDRVLDRPRPADGFQQADVLAAAARDVRRRDGAHQRVLAVRARQAHQSAVLARWPRPVLHLRSGRLPRHLSAEPRERRRSSASRTSRRASAASRRSRRRSRSRVRPAACCSPRSTIRATRFAARRVADASGRR